MAAGVNGVSTRKVAGLARVIGSDPSLSRSEVWRICQGLAGEIQVVLERPPQGTSPNLSLDATALPAA